MERMIPDPHDHFREFVPRRSKLLVDLEAEAEAQAIPIIGPLVGELLYILVATTNARRVLELGTATGYSTLWLAQGCNQTSGAVTTVEMNPALARRARHNVNAAGLADHVDIRIDTADAAMQGMDTPFDLVFMDIDKEYYTDALPHIERLTRRGSLLVVDNTGFRDARPFNRVIFERAGWRSVQLFGFLPRHSPEQDGICLAARV